MIEDYKRKAIKNITDFYAIFQKEVLDIFPGNIPELTPLLSKALFEIYYTENITPSILTRRLAITVPNTSRCLQKLGDLGYINKVKDENDKRITHIKLTEEGIKLVEKSISYMDEVMLNRLSLLKMDELERLSGAFMTIRELFDKIGVLHQAK
ncbi:transcriptional regulator, MarR family [Clostridiales bacterium oral taxon 876 str. F0540]|nr:transcriptional regulator, MarR family [Clostridiales bacterium oral taxon 876 str. F0540]